MFRHNLLFAFHVAKELHTCVHIYIVKRNVLNQSKSGIVSKIATSMQSYWSSTPKNMLLRAQTPLATNQPLETGKHAAPQIGLQTRAALTLMVEAKIEAKKEKKTSFTDLKDKSKFSFSIMKSEAAPSMRSSEEGDQEEKGGPSSLKTAFT